MPRSNVPIQVADVNLSYSTSGGSLEALARVSLQVEQGQAVAIIGPSGCGKSTLLFLLAGMLVPTSGTVLIYGEPITKPRAQTALILQDLGLLPWKTVERNVELGLSLRKVPRNVRRERVGRALAQVGLTGFERRYPAELSGGMRQRLAFARAIAVDADIMLMDEPLSALDALSREALQQVLSDLHRQRRHTSILVTHSIDEAAFLGSRIFVMTPRPAHIAGVVENPLAGTPGYRMSPDFVATELAVRRLLERVVAEAAQSVSVGEGVFARPGAATYDTGGSGDLLSQSNGGGAL